MPKKVQSPSGTYKGRPLLSFDNKPLTWTGPMPGMLYKAGSGGLSPAQQAWNDNFAKNGPVTTDRDYLHNNPDWTPTRNADGSTSYNWAGTQEEWLAHQNGQPRKPQTQPPSQVIDQQQQLIPDTKPLGSSSPPSGYPPMLSRMGAKPNTQYGFGGATYTPETDSNPQGFNPYKPYG